jgi:hypothetical protein
MLYLTVDGMMSGTGIRDSVAGGYLDPVALGLSSDLVERLARWLHAYELAHYRQYESDIEVADLDQEGMEICRLVQEELPESKVKYFSSATLSETLLL